VTEQLEFDELVKYVNELAHKMNAQELMVEAEVIYRRFAKHGDNELMEQLKHLSSHLRSPFVSSP